MKMIRQKLKAETGIAAEPGFPVMGPVHYLTYLKAAHARTRPQVYFEIGTESGASLSFATCTSIAVDPEFQLQSDVSRNKPELHLFQGTSDDFFASNLLGRLGLKIDLAFLDGMHLFEFLLRDFINTERHMVPGGTILMHDCVPFNRVMAERDWDRRRTKSWTGDVWKLIPILREYRPDLTVEVLDLAPTGLVSVTGLDPENRVLSERYDEIVAAFGPLTLDGYGLDRFVASVDLRPTGVNGPRRGRRDPGTGTIAIKTCVPSAEVAESWGDYHFANSLAVALRRMGHAVRVDLLPDWYEYGADDALDIVLQGHDQYRPRDSVPSLLWMIYPGKRFEMDSLRAHEHVFVASEIFARKLARRVPGLAPTVLYQCADPAVMQPVAKPARSELVFVANNHFGQDRPMAAFARAGSHPLKLWGRGWEGDGWPAYVEGVQVANADLGRLYAGSLAVLCDHTNVMGRNGFLSNRVFDALACGAPVVMDRVAALPPGFEALVYQTDGQEAFDAAVAAARGESAARRKERLAFARTMAERHSFDARAAEIIQTAEKLSLL